MTVLAREADSGSGKYYRLTRDSGTSYYMFCRPGAVAKLEKRLVGRDPRLFKPDELRLARELALCRNSGHILALRGTRFIDDKGQRRETRAYVAFTPDYPLREVARPPGYTAKPRKEGAGTDGEEAEADDRRTAG